MMLTTPKNIASFFLILGTLYALTACQSSADSQEEAPPEKLEEVGIEYIAHASFILSYNGKRLLLDPFADSTWISYTFPRNIQADAIFSTHPHYDHDGGIFRDLHPYWEGKIPFYQDPGKYEIGDFNIEGLKGKHCDPYGKEFGQKNTIFIFEVAGLRFAHWGDNGPINDTLAASLIDIDVLMLPIDDSYHILKADETAEVIQRIGPKIVIPMHYKIPALEPTPDKPKNLESIDAYFKNKDNVTRLEGHKTTLNVAGLPSTLQYLIFEHSPAVK